MTVTDPVLDTHWKRVLDDWNDDTAHGAFLEYCEKSDQLLEAAVRYRGMAGDRTRGPSAEKRLAAISMLALSKLESARSVRRSSASRVPQIVLVIFLLASIFSLLASWRSL